MWEQIAANRRRSIALIVGMGVILILIGYTGGELLAGPGTGLFGLMFALVLWCVLMLVYYTSAESILLHGTGARELQREESPRLFNIVDEMKLASGISFTPKIYLINDAAPNAFAVGRDPQTCAIAVTTGLMYRLNRDELQGVIGHEMGHLKNRDVQFMTLAAVMLGSIVILSEIIRRSLWFGGRGRSRSSARGAGQAQVILLIVGLVFAILGPLMAQLLYFACSRKREFLADASSAQFTRYPEGLASALEKIARSNDKLAFVSQATAPMFIVNPLSAGGEELDSVFSSHPPTSERIRILRGMAGASYADYEAAYRRAKGGGLIGAGSLKSAPTEAIRPPSSEGPIETRQNLRDLSYWQYGYLKVRCNCGLEISVPEGYELDTITCIRCGSVLRLPTAKELTAAAKATRDRETVHGTGPAGLQYVRQGRGWESIRCPCGRTVQISPAFRAPQIRCLNCGRLIEVLANPK
jgi:heat shock protein HtpX